MNLFTAIPQKFILPNPTYAKVQVEVMVLLNAL